MTDEANIYQFQSSRSPRRPKSGGGDGWGLDDGLDYDPNKFYLSSRDKDKESMTITANVSRSLLGELDAIIHTRKVPYRTKQDFIRDALYHRMHFINEYMNGGNPQMERVLSAVLAKADAERRIWEMEQYEEALARIEESFTMAVKTGHGTNFDETMVSAEGYLESWPMCGAKERLAAVVDRYQRMAGNPPEQSDS